MYRLEKNIPVLRRVAAKCPFPEMKVGDSFAVPASERHAVKSSAVYFSKVRRRRDPTEQEWKWSIRRVGEDTYRIWRIA